MPLAPVYKKSPLSIHSGTGTLIRDQSDIDYLDFYGGHGVISLGHGHQGVRDALIKQYDQIPYYSNYLQSPVQEQLAAKLCELSGYQNNYCFFVNSGSEAVENALKISWFHTGRSKLVAMRNGFHGRTMHAAMVSDACPWRETNRFKDIVSFIDPDDFDAAEAAIKDDVSAVILEGIQGVGGVRVPSDRYLRHLRTLCDQSGAMLILDEIQSGLGRSGTFFAHQSSGIKADLITMAKGLGNGFPIGVVMYNQAISLPEGSLGSTFGGGHMACVVALEVLSHVDKLLKSEAILMSAKHLSDGLNGSSLLLEVQGKGLMLGLKSGSRTRRLHQALLAQGVMTGTAAKGTEIRLLPPLTVSMSELDLFLKKCNEAAKEL